MPTILLLGPAASGKTTLAKALLQHARDACKYHQVVGCNLDPGSDDGYPWDIDVRKQFTIETIMANHGLGPNGAIVKGYELLAGSVDTLLGDMEHSRSDLVVIDAPGQLEPLIFSNAGNRLLDAMKRRFDDMIAIFLIPGDIVNNPSSFAFLLLVLTGLHLNLHVPLLQVVSKADLLHSSTISYLQDGHYLKDCILKENTGGVSGFATLAAGIVEQLLPNMHLIQLSITGNGMAGLDDLLDLVDEARCSCGDLT